LFDGEWDFAIDAFARMLVRFPEEQMPVAQHLRSVTTQDAYCEFLDAAADHDATCCAPLVWVPTLIMHHEGSRICDMVRSREMLTMIPGALRIEVMTALEGLDQEFLAGTALRFAHEVMTLPSAAGPDALTHREHLVLNLVGSGKSNVEIAADLSISRKTVERHVHNIYAKIGVHNRVEAANWAREHGVV
jgi:DNA-binding CsgD family transcriptional regulator